MSYPNTATAYGLAQVIQGEAGNSADQFAVASTMQNRLTAGGWGSTLSAVVNQPNFNGGTSATIPSANALALGNALQNGNLSDYGDTGNVTYYSASNYSTVRGAANYVNPSMQGVAGAGNTVAPGGNSFSTGTSAGPTLNGTVLPTFGGSSGTSGLQDSDLVDNDYDYYSNASPAAQNAYLSSTGGDASSASAGDGFSLFGGGSTPTGATTGYNATSAGSSGLGGGNSLFGTDSTSDSVTSNGGFDDLDDNIFDQDVSTATTPATSAAAAAGGGAPIYITDLPGADTAITGAGSAVQKGATQAGSDVQTAAGGVVGTLASAFNNAQTYASGALVIIALILMGLVFVAFGLGMFKHNMLPAGV